MEILLKDEVGIYYIENNILDWGFIDDSKVDLANIPHLDDAEVLYHYRNIDTMVRRPVYYEHDGKFITSYDIYPCDGFIKDYTLVNLKLV